MNLLSLIKIPFTGVTLTNSFDQYGEQSGYRQAPQCEFHGNRFRNRIKRAARTARQRNYPGWKRQKICLTSDLRPLTSSPP